MGTTHTYTSSPSPYCSRGHQDLVAASQNRRMGVWGGGKVTHHLWGQIWGPVGFDALLVPPNRNLTAERLFSPSLPLLGQGPKHTSTHRPLVI